MHSLLLLAMLSPLRCGSVVTYEEFGAVGDGRADDQAAIVAAHAAANERGLPVRAGDGRTYYIGGGRAVARIRTDTDFGTARFIIDDRRVEDRTKAVFLIESSFTNRDLTGVASLARNQTSLGVRLSTPCLLVAVNDGVRQFIREGSNRNKGTAQRETFLCAADGSVDPTTPIRQDFPAVTSLTAFLRDERTLTVKGGVFTTIANAAPSRYTYYGRNVEVTRSNVRIERLTHFVTGEGDHGAPYTGFLSVVNAADVTVTGCVFTAHRTYETVGSAGVPVKMGSYDLNVHSSVRVSFADCRQTTDIHDAAYWGLFGSNFCRDLLLDGCSFSRFDAHCGVANATIRNCEIGYMGIRAIGTGTLLLEKTRVTAPTMVSLRCDYGSMWDGEIVIRDCVFTPQGGSKRRPNSILDAWNRGKHDFGYACRMPQRLVVDGLRIEDASRPPWYSGLFVFGDYDERKTETVDVPHPLRPTEELHLARITAASGRRLRLCDNPFLFRGVRVTGDRSVLE